MQNCQYPATSIMSSKKSLLLTEVEECRQMLENWSALPAGNAASNRSPSAQCLAAHSLTPCQWCLLHSAVGTSKAELAWNQ